MKYCFVRPNISRATCCWSVCPPTTCDYLLNAVAARLPGGEVFLVGEKRGGIEGAAKQLAVLGKPRKLDSARHCQLWQVTVVEAPLAKPLESLARHYQLDLAERCCSNTWTTCPTARYSTSAAARVCSAPR